MDHAEALLTLDLPGAAAPVVVDALLTLLPTLCMAPRTHAPAVRAACWRLLSAPDGRCDLHLPALWALAACLYGQAAADEDATLACLKSLLTRSAHSRACYSAAAALLGALPGGPSGAASCRLLLTLLARPGLLPPVQEVVLATLHESQSWIVPQLDLRALAATLAADHLHAMRPRLLPLVERCMYANAGAIDAPLFAQLSDLYRDDPKFRYLLYYLAEHLGVPAEVRAAALAARHGRFPLHEGVAGLLRRDPCRILVVQNIADAQGDELIRLGVLLESLLAASPRLEITVLTGRPYLYAHLRLTPVPIDDHTCVVEVLARRYAVVVNCYEPLVPEANYSLALERQLDAHLRAARPGLLIVAKKGYNHFVYDRLELGPASSARMLELDRQRVDNIYETTFRLVAELGLPLRAGQQPPQHAVLANRPSAVAEAAWAVLTAPNASGRPVALLNPFGGGERLKGYIEAQFTWLAGRIGALCDAGWFVVILPNGTDWGSMAQAQLLVEHLRREWRAEVAIAPDPAAGTGQVALGDLLVPYASYRIHLLTYCIRRADLIVTVEGWMVHAAYLLGRPFRLMMPSYAYHAGWHPYGRTASQDVPLRELYDPLQEPLLPGQPRKILLQAILRATGDVGSTTLPLIRWALASQDRHLRREAAAALGCFDRHLVDADLLALLDDPGARVRGSAAAALLDTRRGPPPAAYRPWAMVERLAGEGQWEALLQLGERGRAAVRRVAEDQDPEINQPARQLLRRIDATGSARRLALPAWPGLGALMARRPQSPSPGPSRGATTPHLERDSIYLPYQRLLREAIRAARAEQLPRCSGAGIVIVAGGPRYFTCAWVLLTILRRVVHCSLPIQIWHLGPDELSPHMIELLRPFDVDVVDALSVRQQHPARRLGGWECKPFAIAHSPFEEVISLDADNVPLVDPAFLLASPEYRRSGAVFWPDIEPLPPENPVWAICGVPWRAEPAVESGQLLIDKSRCWAALSMARHLNDHSDFYYRHTRGDAETFHLAWRVLGQPYAMPAFAPRRVLGKIHPGDPDLIGCLFQRDFQGREIFHHRTTAKWNAWGYSLQVPGFRYQAECQEALAELRALWPGYVAPAPAPRSGDHSTAAALERARWMLYRRVGADQRLLELLPGGQIGEGRGPNEHSWRVERQGGRNRLLVSGDRRTTCALTHDADGVWRGHWLVAEQMPVEIVPLMPEDVQALRTTDPERIRR